MPTPELAPEPRSPRRRTDVKRLVHRFVIVAVTGVVLVALAILGNTFVRGLAATPADRANRAAVHP